jgi:glycyl-tRNA synthetase beta chain
MLGSFDERFLHLPREILITVMRDHQKYFAVEDGQGNLRPHFLAVLNMDSDEKGLIRQGHERVLRARFTDAEFFWNADQRIRLRDRGSILERVTYQVRLGSYADKVKRMRRVGEGLRSVLETNDPNLARYTVAIQDAISLCKCDLTTEMVQEFPELQGIVGGLYATAQGEPTEIAEAIYDHYLPQGAEDRCPATPLGAVVSLADKLDSVVGGLAVGLEPTGSSDPFALRRQCNGIIKVILEFKFPISLSFIIGQALETLDITWRRPSEEVSRQVLEFLVDRLRYYLEAVCSFRYDTVRAVLASGSDVPYEAFLRAQALHNSRGSENLEALCVAAKRIKNILEKSASRSDWSPGEVDESLLAEDAERDLYRAYHALDRDTQALARVGDYQLALDAISTLRPSVDTFFDKVLVMAEDKAVRENRLRLLGKLDRMFSGIAQFSEIASEVETK